MEITPVEVGDVVQIVDEVGMVHKALVTAVWGVFGDYTEQELAEYKERWPESTLPSTRPIPSLNVVFVSNDEDKHDPYGRQIDRKTSIVHKVNQAAHGLYWINL